MELVMVLLKATVSVQESHRLEVHKLGKPLLAHDRDGLVHTSRLGPHILFAPGCELSNALRSHENI